MQTGVAPLRAMREPQGRWIAGVGSGLAEHLGWPLPVVRMGFLVLAVANGLGVILYLALWAVLPLRREDEREAREADLLRMFAFGSVVVALAALAYAWGWGTFRASVAPVLVAGLGLALLWQQARRTGALGQGYQWLAAVTGTILVALAIGLVIVGQVGWQQGVQAASILLLVVGGVALLASPWLVRIYGDLVSERNARIREQERSDIAAKVHDSVLQTLTVIQRNADDGNEVRRLARAEERRLRSWLYAPVGPAHENLASALQDAAARVEDDLGAAVDLVVVGDAPLTPAAEALVAAGTEAMVNAAKYAGAHPQVSVYCEIVDGTAELFVRDRGPGFDPDDIPADRHGIRESVVGRMDRAGGNATVTSSGSGTEVTLRVKVGGP